MDTSETYIKMCDCPEIQGLRKELNDWADCDLYVFDSDFLQVLNTSSDYHNSALYCTDNYFRTRAGVIWLPRQDELQEMILPTLRERWQHIKVTPSQVVKPVSDINREGNWLVRMFSSYLTKNPDVKSNSMEQLWLAFVMFQKFGKTWDGEQWVTQK